MKSRASVFVAAMAATWLLASSAAPVLAQPSKMYWTNSFADKIQRANLDGSSVEDVVTTGVVAPTGVSVDPVGGKVYWTDAGLDRVKRADLDGSDIEDVATGQDNARGIALDLAVGKVYWSAQGELLRADLNGANVELLLVGEGFVGYLTLGLQPDPIPMTTTWGLVALGAMLLGVTSWAVGRQRIGLRADS